jgi:hypothetical protein
MNGPTLDRLRSESELRLKHLADALKAKIPPTPRPCRWRLLALNRRAREGWYADPKDFAGIHHLVDAAPDYLHSRFDVASAPWATFNAPHQTSARLPHITKPSANRVPNELSRGLRSVGVLPRRNKSDANHHRRPRRHYIQSHRDHHGCRLRVDNVEFSLRVRVNDGDAVVYLAG